MFEAKFWKLLRNSEAQPHFLIRKNVRKGGGQISSTIKVALNDKLSSSEPEADFELALGLSKIGGKYESKERAVCILSL